MKINRHIVWALFLLLAVACGKKPDVTNDDIGFDYYPISEGDYFIYDVIDTSFQGSGSFEVSVYQLKEEIHEPITVSEETRYQVYRYYREPGAEWKTQPDSVWTVFYRGNSVVKVEDNVRFVKLIFPLEVNKAWDGNISDTENDPMNYYKLKQVRRPYTYDDRHYSQTVSVEHFNSSSAIDKLYSVEVFAREIGLVYKQILIYRYEQPITFPQKIDLGRHYQMKMIEHGRYK
jgi:hypothetical protein